MKKPILEISLVPKEMTFSNKMKVQIHQWKQYNQIHQIKRVGQLITKFHQFNESILHESVLKWSFFYGKRKINNEIL
jgi:hypothetical protein